MEEKKKFRFKDIWTLLKNSFQAILKGEFLLRLNIGRYFIHIASCCLLVAATIWISLLIDNTLTKVQRNRLTIKAQQDTITVLTFELSKATRRTEVEKRLISMGSDLRDATRPAKRLK